MDKAQTNYIIEQIMIKEVLSNKDRVVYYTKSELQNLYCATCDHYNNHSLLTNLPNTFINSFLESKLSSNAYYHKIFTVFRNMSKDNILTIDKVPVVTNLGINEPRIATNNERVLVTKIKSDVMEKLGLAKVVDNAVEEVTGGINELLEKELGITHLYFANKFGLCSNANIELIPIDGRTTDELRAILCDKIAMEILRASSKPSAGLTTPAQVYEAIKSNTGTDIAPQKSRELKQENSSGKPSVAKHNKMKFNATPTRLLKIKSLEISFANMPSGITHGTPYVQLYGMKHTEFYSLSSTDQYFEYLTTKEWRNILSNMVVFYRYSCLYCNSDENLTIHHLSYFNLDYGRIGSEFLSDVVMLCRHCHEAVHRKEDNPSLFLPPSDIASYLVEAKDSYRINTMHYSNLYNPVDQKTRLCDIVAIDLEGKVIGRITKDFTS